MIVELGIDRQEGTIDQSQFHIYCSLRIYSQIGLQFKQLRDEAAAKAQGHMG